MFDKLKMPLIVGGLVIALLWGGISFFRYFTCSSIPQINLVGIEKNGYYAGVLNCSVKSTNSYKIAELSVKLDGKPLDINSSTKIGYKNFDLPFSLDTLTLSDGQHSIEVEAIDASRNKNKFTDKIDFQIDNAPLKAAFLHQSYSVDQGRTIHVRIQTNKYLAKAQVKFLDRIYDCYSESEQSTNYECFIPIECEQSAGEFILSSDIQDNVKNNMKLSTNVTINPVVFPKQKGFSVAKGKLDEEREFSMSDKILEEAMAKWLNDSPKKKMWSGNFELPVDVKRLATPYGEIRTTQEKGRYLHRAVDLIDHPRSVIWASHNGKVIIKDRFVLTGNTVVLDHGLGVFTLYCHLEDFANIDIGDYVKKGNPIGKLGMTGYANGYHLHWELRVNNTPVDPFEWTKKDF